MENVNFIDLGNHVQSRLEVFKDRFGEDVQVTMEYFCGTGYRDTEPMWYGETPSYRVGPLPNFEQVLKELVRLYEGALHDKH